jgi:hypothetical protein
MTAVEEEEEEEEAGSIVIAVFTPPEALAERCFSRIC